MSAGLRAELARETDEQLEARLEAAQRESATSGSPMLTITQSAGPEAWKWQVKTSSGKVYIGWRGTRREVLELGLADLDWVLRGTP